MTTNPTLPNCERCGHDADWHRLDDSRNVSPDSPAAEFRCLGVDFDGCVDTCPDYVCGELAKAVFAIKAVHPEATTTGEVAERLPEHLRDEYLSASAGVREPRS